MIVNISYFVYKICLNCKERILDVIYTHPLASAPQHLKHILQQWGMSGSYWKKLKSTGCLRVNGVIATSDVLLQPGDRITWSFLPEEPSLEPEAMPITILYEDDVLLAVDKPADLVTHNNDAAGGSALSRRAAWYYRQHKIPAGIHPISRLDRETSGIVLFAKNACIHHMVSQQSMEKTYLGITLGLWQETEGIIDKPIARTPGSIIERYVDASGQKALTHYKVLRQQNGLALVRFRLETGRTHQIRVHCADAGHPLLGDHLYGEPGPQSRHYLHAWQLSFLHPITKERLTITAPIPKDMEIVIKQEL